MAKKIGVMTANSIIGKDIKKRVSKQLGELVELFHVVGFITRYGVKHTPYGEMFLFYGVFRAYRLKDGRVFNSTRFVTRNPASDSLVYLMNEEKGEKISFSCAVSVVSDSSLLGYEYRTDFLVEPFAFDPLADVERRYKIMLAGRETSENKSVGRAMKKAKGATAPAPSVAV